MTTYSVKTEVFQGPFDLLLHLVSRQKLDINAISLTEITDQYVEHLERIKVLDLDVASEFLLLASTLLEIKAASLMPKEIPYIGDDLDDLSPDEIRSILIERLIEYKKYKNVAGELGRRLEAEGRMHPRQASLESDYLSLIPDFLEDTTLHSLSLIYAELASKRELFLLEANHVAPPALSLERRASSIISRLQVEQHLLFSNLVDRNSTPEEVVVTFLAILELYKRGVCSIVQTSAFDDIVIDVISLEGLRSQDIEEVFDDYN